MINNAIYDAKYRKLLKILTPKQMLQILPIALAQVKAGNIPENLLNLKSIKSYTFCLNVIIISGTPFRVNRYSLAAWMPK